MSEEKSKAYRSDDTSLCAYLYCKEHPLLKIESGEFDHIFFQFKDTTQLQADIGNYHADKLIPVLSYWKSLRYLKRLIVQYKRGEEVKFNG